MVHQSNKKPFRFITQKANCLLRYCILGDLVINLHEIDHGLSAKCALDIR